MVGHGVFSVSEVPSPRWDLALALLEEGRGLVLLEEDVTIALGRRVAGPAPDHRLHVSIYAKNEPSRISSPMAAADVRAGLDTFRKAITADPRLSELGERHGQVIEYVYDYGMGAVLVGTVAESGDLTWSYPSAPAD